MSPGGDDASVVVFGESEFAESSRQFCQGDVGLNPALAAVALLFEHGEYLAEALACAAHIEALLRALRGLEERVPVALHLAGLTPVVGDLDERELEVFVLVEVDLVARGLLVQPAVRPAVAQVAEQCFSE
jgi:hypothetical protein